MAALLQIDALRQLALSHAVSADVDHAFRAGSPHASAFARDDNRRLISCWEIGRGGRLTCSWTVEQAHTASCPPD
jgi:hypothetical protein